MIDLVSDMARHKIAGAVLANSGRESHSYEAKNRFNTHDFVAATNIFNPNENFANFKPFFAPQI